MDHQSPSVERRAHQATPKGRQWLRPEQKKTHLVGVPMNAGMIDNIDRYRASLEEDVSRPHAIRMILTEWLKEKQPQD